MKTKYEDFIIFQGNAGSEQIAEIYKNQQESPDEYFEIEVGSKLTGISDKTSKYLFVPECVTEIGTAAFAACDRLCGVWIPKTVKSIQSSLFVNCPKLTFLIVDKDNPCYDSRDNCNAIIDKQNSELVAGCRNTIVPADVKGIGPFAFYMQNGLKSITLPHNLSYISMCAFKDCAELMDVKLPVGIKKIGFGAFAGCVRLSDVLIPPETICIEETAFESVERIWYNGTLEGAPWGAWNMNEG